MICLSYFKSHFLNVIPLSAHIVNRRKAAVAVVELFLACRWDRSMWNTLASVKTLCEMSAKKTKFTHWQRKCPQDSTLFQFEMTSQNDDRRCTLQASEASEACTNQNTIHYLLRGVLLLSKWIYKAKGRVIRNQIAFYIEVTEHFLCYPTQIFKNKHYSLKYKMHLSTVHITTICFLFCIKLWWSRVQTILRQQSYHFLQWP